MSEINDLRERITDLQVDVARLEEKVSYQGDAIDALRSELRPLVSVIGKWKSWMAVVTTVAAALGAGLREVINWFNGRGSA